MSMIATGAERAYLHERGITLDDLRADVRLLNTGFAEGKRLGVMIRNEMAHPIYTTDFIARLFEAEGGDLYEVRTAVLGHLQQGGDPTPFDRILATRYAYRCIQYLEEQAYAGENEVACVGVTGSEYAVTPLVDALRGYDVALERSKQQWWTSLEKLAQMLAQPGPGFYGEAL